MATVVKFHREGEEYVEVDTIPGIAIWHFKLAEELHSVGENAGDDYKYECIDEHETLLSFTTKRGDVI